MKMAKAIRQKAATAEWVAVDTADTYVVNQMRTLAQAFRAQAEIIKKNKKKKKKNELLDKSDVQARRTRPSQEDRRSRLKKAREMSRAGCYDIYITTPEGRDYHSSEFADLPRTPAAKRSTQKTRPPDKLSPISRVLR